MNTIESLAFLFVGLIFGGTAKAQHRFSLSQIFPTTSSVPSPRGSHLAVVLNSGDGPLLVIHGGRDQFGAKSDTWAYVISQDRWSLLASDVTDSPDRPPPLYGMVGGYRYVEGESTPFLYIALGASGNGRLNDNMWVMELKRFTWKQVVVDGDVPSPRHGAIGSLERFSNPDGTVQPALIVSHGYGQEGPLSDTYKCSFHRTDPYRATWRRLRSAVSQYSTRQPHPMWMQANTYTANRDLVVFGGCYASTRTGGACPSSDVWVLNYKQEDALSDEAAAVSNLTHGFPTAEDSIQWERYPSGPAPRVGAVMAQGLRSFEGAYESHLGIAVLYSGSEGDSELPVTQVTGESHFHGGEISVFSTKSRTWVTERVVYKGLKDEESSAFAPRKGASLNAVSSHSFARGGALDSDLEYYVLFGGQLTKSSYSNSLYKLSFDPFVESDVLVSNVRSGSRPLIHGIVMILSWGVVMVVGAFAARYGKSSDGKPRLLAVHVLTQILGLALAWVGVGVVVSGRRGTTASFAHARLGIALIILVSLQPLIASLSLTAHLRSSPVMYNRILMHVRKFSVSFGLRLLHRAMGPIILLLGAVNVTLGLFLIVAPTIVWVHWVVYCVILLLIASLLELAGVVGRGHALTTSFATRSQVRNLSAMTRRQMPSVPPESITSLQDTVGKEDDFIPSAGRESESMENAATGVDQVREIQNDGPPRERLYSESSSVFTYRDPDAY